MCGAGCWGEHKVFEAAYERAHEFNMIPHLRWPFWLEVWGQKIPKLNHIFILFVSVSLFALQPWLRCGQHQRKQWL